jgi:hypothetical protein
MDKPGMDKPGMDKPDPCDSQTEGPEPKGPNLVLIYSILALGLFAAMGFAAMVVYPFWVRR